MKTVQDAYEDHCGVWPEVWNKQYNKTKDYLALCWSNCRGRWYAVFLGDELSDVVCTKQQFIDYGNSLKDKKMESKTVSFQGYEFEVGKLYKSDTEVCVLRGLGNGSLILTECGNDAEHEVYDVSIIKEVSAGKITKAKIIPEPGKVYKCLDSFEEVRYLSFDDIKENMGLADDLEIICEMVEKE